jgi:glycosyltransferase involved in cell wall biosynthesis
MFIDSVMNKYKMQEKKKKKLTIALIGTRGVPANYGGFETCVEEIGKRLVKKGHEVTVYCRNSYYTKKENRYLGMKLVHLPNLEKKTLDTMSHTFLSVWHALFGRYDIYMVFNAANSFFLLPLRLAGKTIAINTDGLEWKRSKWGFAGKTYYKLAEKVSCLLANRLVSDSKGMRAYYKDTHGMDSTEIAYGAPIQSTDSSRLIQELGLEPQNYFLQITRFEPENYPLLTVQTFKKLNTDKKLVLVGGNPYPNEYTRAMVHEANQNVIFPGFIYDQEMLKELWCNCYAYIHGNSVGGTNPALLQTMASGCFTIASDISFNHDVLADCGIFYRTNLTGLVEKMQWALDNGGQLDSYRKKAQQRILTHYTWDKIADQYETLFQELTQGKYPWRWGHPDPR